MSVIKIFSILLFLLILLTTGCKTTDNWAFNRANLNIYYNKSQMLKQSGKYSDLKKLSDKILERNPDEYQAAFNRAYAMEMMRQDGLTYYREYINRFRQTPQEYKKKWLDLAWINRGKERPMHLNRLLLARINLPSSPPLKGAKQEAHIYSRDKLFILLDSTGALYKIDRKSGERKKINYSNTGGFINFGSYLVFNDSVNLIRYNPATEEYLLIKTLETDKIRFIKHNINRNNGIVGYNFEGQDYVIYINFDSLVIKKLPDNFVDQSFDLRRLAIKSGEIYEIFNLDGEKVFELVDYFYGFTRKGGLLVNHEGYLTLYDITSGHSKEIIYLPIEQESPEKVKVYPFNSRIVVELKDKLLITDYEGRELQVVEGSLVNTFSTGILFQRREKLFYLDFRDDKSYYELGHDPAELIYSDSDSPIFAIEKGKILEIYDLSHFR